MMVFISMKGPGKIEDRSVRLSLFTYSLFISPDFKLRIEKIKDMVVMGKQKKGVLCYFFPGAGLGFIQIAF